MKGMLKQSTREPNTWLGFVSSPAGIWLYLNAWFASEQDGRTWMLDKGITNIIVK